jgi:hypothetical protein
MNKMIDSDEYICEYKEDFGENDDLILRLEAKI